MFPHYSIFPLPIHTITSIYTPTRNPLPPSLLHSRIISSLWHIPNDEHLITLNEKQVSVIAILAQLAARQSHNLKAVSSNLTCRNIFFLQAAANFLLH